MDNSAVDKIVQELVALNQALTAAKKRIAQLQKAHKALTGSKWVAE